MCGAQHSQLLLPPMSAGKGGSEDPTWENPGVSTRLGLSSGTSSWWPSRSHSVLHHLTAAPQECPVRLNSSKSLSGYLWNRICSETMSSYWCQLMFIPFGFLILSPLHSSTQKSRAGQDGAVTVRRAFRWQQTEHTELWLGQTPSAMTGLGGLVLPSSVGTR